MKVSDYLSREDVAYFTTRSDWQAWRLVVGNWLFIAAIFAAVAAWPNPATMLLAIVLLAGRQLGLSVLMHDCGHRTLFNTPRLNDVVGQWLCALPVMNDQPSYARGHLEHHRSAGTPQDPRIVGMILGEPLHQTGLADTSLTADEDNRTRAPLGICKRTIQDFEVDFALKQVHAQIVLR